MKHQLGVALITVLLVVFLVSVTATSLASLQQFSVRRSTVLAHQQQARLYALGAEQWAGRILTRDGRTSEHDHLAEEWAEISPVLAVDGGAISGHIEDLQGRFNVNNLIKEGVADEAQLAIFRRLLDRLRLSPDVAQAVADWIDPDQETRFPGGAEDSTYLRRGYLSADRKLVSISELRLIEGIDEQVYTTLAPYVIALPDYTKININTAATAVLAALDEQLDIDQAEALLVQREPDGYASIDGFLSAAGLLDSGLSNELIALSSRYFMVSVQAEIGTANARLHSLLRRTNDSSIVIQARSFGETL